MKITNIRSSTKYKYIMILLLVVSSCTSTTIKSSPGPIDSESNYLNFKKKNQHFQYLFVGKYLWLFYDSPSKKIEIISQHTKKEISYEKLPTFPCLPTKINPSPKPDTNGMVSQTGERKIPTNPECIAFPDNVFRSIRTRLGRVLQGVRVQDGNVLMNLDRDKVYTFKPNGELIKFEKGSFVNGGPYASLGWKVDEKGGLSYKAQKIKAAAWHFRFSGSLVATYDHELKEVSLFDVRSGKLIEAFPKSRNGPELIEANNGFYFSKRDRNVKWYGGKVIELESEKNNKFCYVFKEEKKCINDPDGKLRRVNESTYFRTYLGEWNDLYIEFK